MTAFVLCLRASVRNKVLTGWLQLMTAIANKLDDWIGGDDFLAIHSGLLSLSIRPGALRFGGLIAPPPSLQTSAAQRAPTEGETSHSGY
jgi:hypothetical protein